MKNALATWHVIGRQKYWLIMIVVIGFAAFLGGSKFEGTKAQSARAVLRWYPGSSFLDACAHKRASLSYDSDPRRSLYQLSALHFFPSAYAEESMARDLRALKATFTSIYESGNKDSDSYSTGWSKDDHAVSEALKASLASGIDFQAPRLSEGYFFPDHNEGGRCAILIDRTNRWLFFYSTFDD